MSDLKFPKKKRGAKKLTASKVQEYFNAAIRRRDNCCMTAHSPCAGSLECSHFFAKGGNGSLRFYPPNCITQCTGHHFEYHNRNPMPFVRIVESHGRLEWMETARRKTIRYTQEVLRTIAEMCQKDMLYDLTKYIEELIDHS